jgi:hypothetical protein
MKIPASTGTSRNSCGAQNDEKGNTLHKEGVLITGKERKMQIVKNGTESFCALSIYMARIFSEHFT